MLLVKSVKQAIGSWLMGKAYGWAFDRIPEDGGPGDSLKSPYKNSVWVMRAIKEVAGPIAAVSLAFTVDKRGGEQAYEEPDLAAWWRSPVQGLSYYDFVEASVGWLKLRGEVFYICDDTWLRPFPEQGSLNKPILARPDRMHHVVDSGKLMGWEYRDGGGKTHTLLPEQVQQIKNWHPYNEWRGLGEMEAALIAAESDYLAGKFMRNLMRNNGDLGSFLVAKNGTPTQEQKAQIIAALRDKRSLSQRGHFKTAFLTGDVTVENPKVQGTDANFLQGRLHNRHEIFIAFGVPASMADVIASYSIGSSSDRFRLIGDTCMPTAEKLADGIEPLVRKQTKQNLYVSHNWDEHPVMQSVRAERMTTAEKLWDRGMPMEKINNYLGLGMPEYEGWDVGYLPFSVAPASSIETPETDESFAEPIEEEEQVPSAGQDMISLLEGRGSSQEKAQWLEHMKLRRPVMKNYATKFRKELMKARREALQKVEANFQQSITQPPLSRANIINKAVAEDFVFDLEAFESGLLGAMRLAGKTALNTAGAQMLKELGRDDPFSFAPEEVLTFVAKRENRLKDVPASIHEQIKATLQEGLDAGDTQSELAARVRTEFNGISKARAETIAQTETSAAYGHGRQEAMQTVGIKKKKWLTSGNTNVRPAHRAANKQTVAIEKTFLIGGEALLHPGDSNGSPENVINCHCVSIAAK